MNLLDSLNSYGPNKCRFLARSDNGRRPLTNEEISKRSGLSRSNVVKLSHRRNWNAIPMETAVKFSLACGIDLRKPRTSFYRKLRRSKQYLKGATVNQRKMLASLLMEFGTTAHVG